MTDIYIENGYKDRNDYLVQLADEFGVDLGDVIQIAEILGNDEDFDGLLIACQDMERLAL